MRKLSCFGGSDAVRLPACRSVADNSAASTWGSVRGTQVSVPRSHNAACDGAFSSITEQCPRLEECNSANGCPGFAPQENPPVAASRQTCATSRGTANNLEAWASLLTAAGGQQKCDCSALAIGGKAASCSCRQGAGEEFLRHSQFRTADATQKQLRCRLSQRTPCIWTTPRRENPAHFYFIRLLWLFVYFLVVDIVMAVVGVSSDYFYMTDPQPQLKDRVHDWIFGGTPPSALPEYVADCLTVALLVLTGVRHLFFVRLPLSVMIICRCIAIIITVYVLRTIAIFVTTMPAPVEPCTPPPEIATASGFMMQAFLAASFQVSLCTDMIVSGHTLTTSICMATWLFYNNCNKNDDRDSDVILFYYLLDQVRSRWARCLARCRSRAGRGGHKKLRDQMRKEHSKPASARVAYSRSGGGRTPLRGYAEVAADGRRPADEAPDLHACESVVEKEVLRIQTGDGGSSGGGRQSSAVRGGEAGSVKEELEEIALNVESSSSHPESPHWLTSEQEEEVDGQQLEVPGTVRLAEAKQELCATFGESSEDSCTQQKETAFSLRRGKADGEVQLASRIGDRSAERHTSKSVTKKSKTKSSGAWLHSCWAKMCEWNLLGVYCVLHGAATIVVIDFSFCHYTVDVCFGLLVGFAIYTAYHMILSLIWVEKANAAWLATVATGDGAAPCSGCLDTETSRHFGKSHDEVETFRQQSGSSGAMETTRAHAAAGRKFDGRSLVDGLRGEVCDPRAVAAAAILDFPLIRIFAFLIRRLEGLD
ncbi:putative transmembrane protein [Toxoplasma gondii GAB2-2007-GAL-DOM2]|uniref:Transmembrane protein n=2 Tax=Toxoplasma gondii TaxID=5811 RepID=V4ZK39_TOXGV|nr:putative transmembrane protein [Toxoplasma gondii VEG]KFG46856.1 putative transmembrane protein [Toxoplasma gondii GAB2-2007-GAL-DOM2]